MANNKVVLQWNCRGLKTNRNDLDLLIKDHNNPAVLCLQETMLDPSIEKDQNNPELLPSFVKIRNYKGYYKCIDSGKNGIAIFVHNRIFHSPVQLKTKLQALAVRITFQGKDFIVSNHLIL